MSGQVVDERSRSINKKDDFDFRPMQKGITLLKFGNRGPAHEKLFKLSGDKRFITWGGRWFSPKLGRKCVVDLEKAIRLQPGQMTYKFERLGHAFGLAKEKSFSILYSDGEKGNEVSLDLIAPTASIYKYWFKGIKKILERIHDVRAKSSPDELFIKQSWEKADRDHDGVLSFIEITKLVAELNINMPKSSIKVIFDRVDVDKSGQLNIDEFTEFVRQLRDRSELDYIWNLVITYQALPDRVTPFPLKKEDKSIEMTKKVIDMGTFLDFWTATQGEDLSAEDAFDMITDQHKTNFRPVYGDSDFLTLESFDGFEITRQMWKSVMSSAKCNDLFLTEKRKVYQDMTLPLSAYYMASSHNTYLEGDQLTSASSTNRYVSDLLSGCRCVELDCWDGENKEPVIFHGFTLTSKINFKDVIEAIAEYAFQNSPYPVVLSIENHCGLEQQQRMAFYMRSIFKGKLLMPRPDMTKLPSPEELREKFILKGKRDATQMDIDTLDEEDGDEEASEADSSAASKSQKQVTEMKNKHSSKIHPDLSAITFLGTAKIREFDGDNSPADLMSSYSENATIALSSDPEKQKGWIGHNETHLSRIYPKGTRVDSSNYNPAPAWASGAQLVALNYQTKSDVNTMANTGKFRENGSCGYVLKPAYLRSAGDRSPPIRLSVHVLSGQQLPKPGGERQGEIIDPYITLTLTGVPEDASEQRTLTINDNGFNPTWNEVFIFDIQNPDVAVLTLQVFDEDIASSEFIGCASLPVTCVRSGLRTIGLYDINGGRERDYAYATLFVRIRVEPMPDTPDLASFTKPSLFDNAAASIFNFGG